jgi:hypothetical protein
MESFMIESDNSIRKIFNFLDLLIQLRIDNLYSIIINMAHIEFV